MEIRKGWVIALLIAMLAVVVYLPVLDNGFINFDDPLYVTANPMVQRGLAPDAVAWALTANVASNWHPLTLYSHMLDVELFGLAPRGHHLTSLLLHAANAALLFAVLVAMTGPLIGRGTSRQGVIARASLVAALFAVHPGRVESVAWVAERKDVLSTFFGLLTLAAYVTWTRRGGRGPYLLVAVALALGLMAKPMLVTWPFLLLLLDAWPLGRLPPRFDAEGRRVLWARIREKLPLFALVATASAIAVLTQGGALDQVAARPLGARLANAAVSYASYLRLTFWPRDLAVFYPFPETLPVAQVAGATALLAAFTVLALVLLRRAPYLAVGWFWFLGTLVPVIGLLPVGGQALADRYTYVTTIGLYLALVWGAAELLPRHRRWLAALAGVAILVLAARTHAQIAHWRDSETLFRHALEATDDNYLAHVNLAESLRRRDAQDEALEHYRAAVALRPDVASNHAALGGALHAWERPADALPHLERAAELGSRDPRVHHVLALVLEALGRGAEALAPLARSIELDPAFAPGHRDLAIRYDRRGDVERAIHHYREALRAPDLPFHGRLGALLGQRGELDEAVHHLREAVRRQPESATDRFNLGVTLARVGDLEGAVRELRIARELAPDRPEIPRMLARALEAAGRHVEAEAIRGESEQDDSGL